MAGNSSFSKMNAYASAKMNAYAPAKMNVYICKRFFAML
jgi:hypothetical protein